MHIMIDTWRKLQPENNEFTYRGNQVNKPKCKLDRIWKLPPPNQLRSDMPILCASRKSPSKYIPTHGNTLLKNKYVIDFMTKVIQCYSALATEGENIHHL